MPKENQSWILVKVVKVILFRAIALRISNLTIELSSIPNTILASGHLSLRSRVGVSGWKTTERKHQEEILDSRF